MSVTAIVQNAEIFLGHLFLSSSFETKYTVTTNLWAPQSFTWKSAVLLKAEVADSVMSVFPNHGHLAFVELPDLWVFSCKVKGCCYNLLTAAGIPLQQILQQKKALKDNFDRM